MYFPMDDVFELTLSLDTNAYADGDVLADTQEIENVFTVPGKCVILNSIMLLDKDDQGGALDLVFMRNATSLGTENAALNISDANAAEIMGLVPIAAADYHDLVNSQMVIKGPSDEGMGYILQPNALGGTSLFVGAISRDTKTYSASGILLKIGVLRS